MRCVVKVGSFGEWAVIRTIQLASFGLFLHYTFRFDSPHIQVRSGAAFLCFLILTFVMFFNRAFGKADEGTLSFRRYFRRHAASWDDVKRVDWNNDDPRVMTLTFERRIGISRKAVFSVMNSSEDFGAYVTGHWVPHAVAFIMNRLRPAA